MGNDNADRMTAMEEILDRLQFAGFFCLSLVGLKFPRSGHCLSDGVATATDEVTFLNMTGYR
jgi:hypothetical protein